MVEEREKREGRIRASSIGGSHAERGRGPAAAADRDTERLRTLNMHDRGILIESACEAAAAIDRSRLAAGLPAVEPAPWPPSTWEFFRKHTARVRT
jgi:hypothetical protein